MEQQFKLERECFYKLIAYFTKRAQKRQQLINASIFRYKHLFRKSFIALKQYKAQPRELMLKKKVFRMFNMIAMQQQSIIKAIQIRRLRQLFNGLRVTAHHIAEEIRMNMAITELCRDRLLIQGFRNLSKAVKISKKMSELKGLIIRRKKQLWVDRWLLALQNHRFLRQLNMDAKLFYQQNLLRKSLNYWIAYQEQQSRLQSQLKYIGAIFDQWRIMAIESQNRINSKYRNIHSKYLLRDAYNNWRDSAIETQKSQLAEEFYKYKVFQRWKQYMQKIKNIEENLIHQELQLTLSHMRHLQQWVIGTFIAKYKQSRERKGLVKLLVETKHKSSRMRIMEWGFKAFKSTWMISHFQQIRTIKKIMSIFTLFRHQAAIRRHKQGSLLKHIMMKQQLIKEEFIGQLRQLRDISIHQQGRATQIYEKRLIRDYFQVFVAMIIEGYQQKNQLALDFNYHRKLIFIFGAIRKHAIDQIQTRHHNNVIAKHSGYKDYQKLKKIFITLKVYSRYQQLLRRKQQFRVYNVFYQWRLYMRMKHIQ